MSETGKGLLSDKPSFESIHKSKYLPSFNNFDFDEIKHEIKELSRHVTKTKRSIQKEFVRFRMVMLFFFIVTMFLPLFDMIDIYNIKNGLYSFAGAFLLSHIFEHLFLWLTLFKNNRKLKTLDDKLYLPQAYNRLSNKLKEVGAELSLYPNDKLLQRQFEVLNKTLILMDKKVESINYKNKY